MGNISSQIGTMHTAFQEADLPLDLTEAELAQQDGNAPNTELDKEFKPHSVLEHASSKVTVFKDENEYEKVTCFREESQLLASLTKVIVIPCISQHIYNKDALPFGKCCILYGRKGMRKLSMLLYILGKCKYTSLVVGQHNAHFFMDEFEELKRKNRGGSIALILNKVRLNNPNGKTELDLLETMNKLRFDSNCKTKVFICMDERPKSSGVLQEIMGLVDTEVYSPSPNIISREMYMKKRLRKIEDGMDYTKRCSPNYRPKIAVDIKECVQDMEWVKVLAKNSEGCTFEEMENFLYCVIDQMIKSGFNEATSSTKQRPAIIKVTKNDFLDRMVSYYTSSMDQQYRLTSFNAKSEDSLFNSYYRKSREQEDEIEARKKERLERKRQRVLEENAVRKEVSLRPSVVIAKKKHSASKMSLRRKL